MHCGSWKVDADTCSADFSRQANHRDHIVRTAFIEQLIVEARRNPRIFLVVGDLGYSVIEPFQAEFPDRFLNAGVAEQNMTGMAAGLASEGFHVFTYSIGNFPTLRCLEQIRNDVCYHNFPVTVVAVGAGMAYGNMGYSHHCVQDIACLRGMPNLTLLSPADPGETVACVEWLSKHPGPSYLRLGKAGEPKIHSQPVTVEGPVRVVDHGGRIAIVATGSVLSEAVSASAILSQESISCDVYSMIRLSPVRPHDFEQFNSYQNIVTVEEHVGPGGLGELMRSGVQRGISVESLAVNAGTASCVGTQSVLRQLSGLNAESMVECVRQLQAGMQP
jgi:transketolase